MKVLTGLWRRLKAWRANQLWYQRWHWKQELAAYDWQANEIFGNEWGNPDNANDRLGNYLALKERLIALIPPQSVVLEIGSLAGKWTQYILHANKIICVDINSTGFDYIRRKWPTSSIEFYLTKGNELKGIASSSVDVVFSLDTLVRVKKAYIVDYLNESFRVLKAGGRILLHLPCDTKEDCGRRGFTRLSESDIRQIVTAAGFNTITIDAVTLVHGVLVDAIKAE